jgi:hypothetical protein
MKAILFLLMAALLSAAAVPDEQARAPQRVLSPARVDGINDFAVFGPGAAEVWIHDRRGRRVFHAVRQGAPIVWDAKDPSGRVRDAGVYVARIRKTDAGVCYQSFVLVK